MLWFLHTQIFGNNFYTFKSRSNLSCAPWTCDMIPQSLSRPLHSSFLGPPMAHYYCEEDLCYVLYHLSNFILFRITNDFWFPFDGNLCWWSDFTLPPLSNDGTKYLFIQIDDYEWAILSRLSSRPWYIIVIFCGNSPKIHRHGTLAKTTKYSSSPENIGLHTKQIVIKWPKKEPQDTKLWECSHPPTGPQIESRPQPAINYNYHFRYHRIIGHNARRARPGKRALAMECAHLLLLKYARNARNCEICPELYWLWACFCGCPLLDR